MIKNRRKGSFPFLIQPPVYFVTTPTGSFVTEDKDGNDCLFVFTDEDSTRPFLERARQLPDLAGVPFSLVEVPTNEDLLRLLICMGRNREKYFVVDARSPDQKFKRFVDVADLLRRSFER